MSVMRETLKFGNTCPHKGYSEDWDNLDEAVASILESGEEFTFPNVDLLIRAIEDTPWDGDEEVVPTSN